jgi:RNA-directed DNA polymerase
MRHGRGNPDPEVGRTRHAVPPPAPWSRTSGRRTRQQGRRGPLRSQIRPQSAETGEPSAWGRGGQVDAACPGNMDRTWRAGPPRSTCLQGIATKAREQPKPRCGTLDAGLHAASRRACGQDIRQEAAYGVDHGSADADEPPLEENIRDLVERRKGKRSRAQLVKWPYIPKGKGQRRPRGIPTVEDQLLQRAVARILAAIDEQDFRRCSDGYRPTGGAVAAVDTRTITLPFGPYHVVVDADIQGFLDNIQHGWLSRRLAERLEDGARLRLMRTWLKAGVLETDGQVIHPATGTPQGGVLSPILANVSRH